MLLYKTLKLFPILFFIKYVKCNNYVLCSPKNDSCSDQLWSSKSNNTCEMIFYEKNSNYCHETFDEKPLNIDRGYVKLLPFEGDLPRTVFEIQIYNITWDIFKMKFRIPNKINCMKREFRINSREPVPGNKYLKYNCPWVDSRFENEIIDFEYAYGINNVYEGKRTFIIQVPRYENLKETDIKNLKFFMYVETTDLYNLVLKIDISQAKNIEYFEIYISHTRKNITSEYGPQVRTNKDSKFDVIDFHHETYGKPGQYIFKVRPYNCYDCKFSESPIITIPETSEILTIGIVGISCLIPIFLIILFMFIKYYPNYTPSVLIISTPSNNAHETVGKALALLLKNLYKINVMIDIIDIPKTKNMNPLIWIRESFTKASHIVYLISNDNLPNTNLYNQLDEHVFSLMNMNDLRDKNYCILSFSYSKDTLPDDLKNLNFKHFKLMKDFNNFLIFLNVFKKVNKTLMNNEYHNGLVTAIQTIGHEMNHEDDRIKIYNIQNNKKNVSDENVDNINNSNESINDEPDVDGFNIHAYLSENVCKPNDDNQDTMSSCDEHVSALLNNIP